ncbi:DUF2314 domain-containing protein [Sphingomonas sp. RT2P30]|uniref:DUF2314 domain-containing protein n=1 Tax=Parasphingomonas halimpatiens TaxID=3096162 RepID=UPI002FCAFAFE
MTARWVVPALFMALAGAGAAPAQDKSEKPTIVWIEASDPAMNAAIAGAKAELPQFFAHWRAPAADERAFTVKFDVIPGDRAEFIWAVDLRRDTAGVLSGTLVDDAELDPTIKGGQRVTIADAGIIDWGYRRKGVMQGSYTVRVMLDHMDRAEAASLRRDLGW